MSLVLNILNLKHFWNNKTREDKQVVGNKSKIKL